MYTHSGYFALYFATSAKTHIESNSTVFGMAYIEPPCKQVVKVASTRSRGIIPACKKKCKPVGRRQPRPVNPMYYEDNVLLTGLCKFYVCVNGTEGTIDFVKIPIVGCDSVRQATAILNNAVTRLQQKMGTVDSCFPGNTCFQQDNATENTF